MLLCTVGNSLQVEECTRQHTLHSTAGATARRLSQQFGFGPQWLRPTCGSCDTAHTWMEARMHCIRSYSAEGMTGNVQYGDTDNNNNNKLVVRLCPQLSRPLLQYRCAGEFHSASLY